LVVYLPGLWHSAGSNLVSNRVDDFDIEAIIGPRSRKAENASAADDLARRGFAVFPIYLRDSGDWLPIAGWPEKATADPEQVAAWWRRWPNARVGLPAGERNGVTIADVDTKNGKDGVSTLAALGFPDLAALTPVRVRTPSGGWHLFFRYDERLKNWVGKIGEGIDIRNNRGFVVAPGSLKGDSRYEPVGSQLGECDLPAFPEVLIPPPEPERAPVEVITNAAANQIEWAEDQLSELAGRLAATAAGGRNDTLNHAAMWAGGAGAHGFLDRDAVRAVLWAAAEAAGMREPEFRTTFRSGWEAGVRKPIAGFPPSPDVFDDLGPPELGSPTPPTTLTFLRPVDCEESPSRGYVIKGLLAPRDVGCIYGAPGAGKSLIAPYLGYQVALGDRAFGMRTKRGRVLYIAPEDPHGLRGRIAALRAEFDDAPDFQLVEGVTNLLDPHSPDLKAVREAVAEHKPDLIFLDTVAAAFPGLEENTAEHMGLVVHFARSLTVDGAAVCLIHHDTKQQSPTPRGHSVLNGALDVALQLFPRDEDGIIRGKLSKNRNGPCDKDIAFRIALLDRGDDEDGDPIRLPYVRELTGPAPRRDKLPRRAQAALAILSELKAVSATVTEAEWRAACVDGRRVSPAEQRDSRAAAFKRALGDLANANIVDVREGMVLTRAELEPNDFDEALP